MLILIANFQLVLFFILINPIFSDCVGQCSVGNVSTWIIVLPIFLGVFLFTFTIFICYCIKHRKIRAHQIQAIYAMNNHRFNSFDVENPVINDDISVSSVPSYKPKSPENERKKKEDDLPTYEQFTSNLDKESIRY